MDIKKTSINYRYADDGFSVTRVDVSYQAYEQTGDQINATAAITSDQLPQGQTFDDVTAKDLDKLGRARIASWFAAVAPQADAPVTDAEK